MKICLAKMHALKIENADNIDNQQLDVGTAPSEMAGGNDFLKLAEQNTFLKNQMKVQKATKKFFSELTKNN